MQHLSAYPYKIYKKKKKLNKNRPQGKKRIFTHTTKNIERNVLLSNKTRLQKLQ